MARVQRVPDALAMSYVPISNFTRAAGRFVGKVWALHYHSISCLCPACKHADVVVIGLTSPVMIDWDIEPDTSLSATQSQDLPRPFIGVQTG